MIESGYYKHFKGEYYWVICEAIFAKENNTQERWVVYKQIEKDMIFIRPLYEFEEFIETEEGERLKRFKKVDNNIPYIPPKPYTFNYQPIQTINTYPEIPFQVTNIPPHCSD